MIGALALNLFMLAGWWRFAARFAGGGRAWRLMLALLFHFTQLILVTQLLALAGLLSPRPLLGVNFLVAGVVWLGAARSRQIAQPAPAIVAIPPVPPRALRIFLVFLASLFGVVIALTLRHAWLHAPFTYDDLCFRLPTAMLMRQSGGYAIGPTHLEIIDPYPRAMEMWLHWIFVTFRSDRWVDAHQLPWLALAMLAVHALAGSLGLSRHAARAAALFFPFAPIILVQLMTAYVDVGFTALILAALALWMRLFAPAPRVEQRLAAFAFGCSLGLICATKFTGPAYAALLLVAAGLACFRGCSPLRWARPMDRDSVGAPCPAVRDLISPLLIALPLLLVGAFPYARNILVYGNPLYPYQLSLPCLGPLPGAWVVDQSFYDQVRDVPPPLRVLRSWLDWRKVHHSGVFGGFGLAWPLGFACLLGALPVALRRRAFPLLVLVLLFVGLFLLTPFNFRARYALFLPALGALAFAWCLDLLVGAMKSNAKSPFCHWIFRALLLAALAVAFVSVAQLMPNYYRPVLRPDRPARERMADVVNYARPAVSREALRALRARAHPGSTVLYFGGGELFIYCLWNASFSNAVHYARCHSAAELAALLARRPGALLFIPKSAAEYPLFLAVPPPHELIYEDAGYLVVALAPAPSP